MPERFEDAIKALRHIARGNGSVMRIADRIVAAHEREYDELRMKFVNVNRHAQHVERENESLKAELDRVLGEQEDHAPDTWERIIEDAIGEGMARQRNNDSGNFCERANPMNNGDLVARCKSLAGE